MSFIVWGEAGEGRTLLVKDFLNLVGAIYKAKDTKTRIEEKGQEGQGKDERGGARINGSWEG